MLIKDLEISKELSRKDLSAVRGGNNTQTLAQGGQVVASGGGLFNTTAANNSPVGVQSIVAPVTVVDLDTAIVTASLGMFIFQ
jgi:hypothetical protein